MAAWILHQIDAPSIDSDVGGLVGEFVDLDAGDLGHKQRLNFARIFILWADRQEPQRGCKTA